MRAVLLSIGAAALLLNFACSQYEGDASGSTGLNCDGVGTAPACFAWNGTVSACFPAFPGFPATAPEPVPATFLLTVQSGSGGEYCTIPGTVGALDVVSANQNNVAQGTYQTGTIEVSEALLDCGETLPSVVSSSFAYYPKAYGASIFNIDLSNKANFSLYLSSVPNVDLGPQTYAQFCYETDSSGTYRLTSEDGSQQSGTWTR